MATHFRISKSLALAVAVISIGMVTAYLVLPIIALFLHTSPELFISSLSEPKVIDALVLSLMTSTIAMVVIVIVGTPAAYFHSRMEYPGKSIVDILIDLPLVLPPAVAGLALLLLYGRMGLIGQYLHLFGIDIGFTIIAVIMAQIFVASPFYLRQAKALFRQTGPFIRTDGKVSWRFTTLCICNDCPSPHV